MFRTSNYRQPRLSLPNVQTGTVIEFPGGRYASSNIRRAQLLTGPPYLLFSGDEANCLSLKTVEVFGDVNVQFPRKSLKYQTPKCVLMKRLLTFVS